MSSSAHSRRSSLRFGTRIALLGYAALVVVAAEQKAFAQSGGPSVAPTFVSDGTVLRDPPSRVESSAPEKVKLRPVTVPDEALNLVPAGGFAAVIPAAPRFGTRGRGLESKATSFVPEKVVNSSFGYRRDPFSGSLRMHTGIDLHADYGETVGAAYRGTVIFAAPKGGYGNLVIVDHGRGVSTYYGHLSGIAVTRGQRVLTGQIVGYAGSTGRSTGAHLHYEVRAHGRPVNPSAVITFSGKRVLADGVPVTGPIVDGGDEAEAAIAKPGTPQRAPLPPKPKPLLVQGVDSLTSY